MPSSSTEDRENPAEHKTERRAHTSECLPSNRKYLLWTQRYVYVWGWNFFFFPVLQTALHNRKKVFLDIIKINITRPINLQTSYSPVNANKSSIFSHLFPAKGHWLPFPSSSSHAENRQICVQVPCLSLLIQSTSQDRLAQGTMCAHQYVLLYGHRSNSSPHSENSLYTY